MKNLISSLAVLSIFCSAYAAEFTELWHMDMNATNFGFSYKQDSIVANESNTAVGKSGESAQSRASTLLDYDPIGGFEWGTTILKVSGTLDFTAAVGSTGGAQWFGLAFTDSSNTTANGGYPFAWVSGDGWFRVSSNGSGNQQATLATKNDGIRVGNKFSFEYTFDTTKDEKFIEFAFVFKDEDGNLLLSNGGLLDTNSVDISGKNFSRLAITYNDNGGSVVAGWLEDFSISGMNIPEPSTIAAIFGLLSLGLVLINRRRK